jgi:Mce-associated membrane protein
MTPTSDETAGDMSKSEVSDRKTDRPRPRPRPYASPAEPDAGAITKPQEEIPTQVVETEPAMTQAGRRRGMPGAASLVAAALVVAAFVAANVWLYVERSNNDGTAAADGLYPINGVQPAAITSARERIPALLSYKYTDVGSYIATAPDNATGQFKKDFTELITRVIAPAAKAQKIVTHADVKSVGVIEAHPGSVTVLVMLDQTTTSKKTKGARVDGSRVRVVMTQTGGKWLVSSLTPI